MSHDTAGPNDPQRQEELEIDRATRDADDRPLDPAAEHTDLEAIAASLGAALTERRSMPSRIAEDLIAEGEAIVGARTATKPAPAIASPTNDRRSDHQDNNQGKRLRIGPGWFAAAAGIALVVGAGAVTWGVQTQRRGAERLADARSELGRLRERVSANETVLANARAELERANSALDTSRSREIELAALLSDVTADLDSAMLSIASLTAPVDPAEIRAGRERILTVPGTARFAFKPFDLPGDPAEQGDIGGEVVWNDELQQGYLRFVGLRVNDPAEEQYQVWVIDERGLEQKVSGGVFNANAEGEIMVPIEPGIDVGRVALFAVTIEEPGGTWVPDLTRRVVVAEREEG